MAVIVEDGSKVAGANSYVSRAAYIAYAATVGVTIPDTVASDVELIKAALYIDEHDNNLKGYRTARDQSMAFPRIGLLIESWYWSSSEIPRQVTLCQQNYAMDINAGRDLWNVPTNPNPVLSGFAVSGVYSESYATGAAAGQKLTRTSTGDALLAQLLKQNGLSAVQLVRA